MPKIRDLGINTIPSASPAKGGALAGGYQACGNDWTGAKAPEKRDPDDAKCLPTHACDPTDRDRDRKCAGTEERKDKKDTRGLPDHAVIQLRQQLQHQISP